MAQCGQGEGVDFYLFLLKFFMDDLTGSDVATGCRHVRVSRRFVAECGCCHGRSVVTNAVLLTFVGRNLHYF